MASKVENTFAISKLSIHWYIRKKGVAIRYSDRIQFAIVETELQTAILFGSKDIRRCPFGRSCLGDIVFQHFVDFISLRLSLTRSDTIRVQMYRISLFKELNTVIHHLYPPQMSAPYRRVFQHHRFKVLSIFVIILVEA